MITFSEINEKYAIEIELIKCLSPGKYVQLFLNDLVSLVIHQGISPEVIFREIRAMEGKDMPLLIDLDANSCQIWFGNHETKLNRNPSATKEFSKFTRPPLKGLYHKHYFVRQSDFIEINIENQQKKYPDIDSLGAMMTRIAEGNLTGEWIVFKRKNGINTYLCLAKHSDGGNVIFKRLIENNVDIENHDCF